MNLMNVKKVIILVGIFFACFVCLNQAKAFEIKSYNNMPVEGDLVLSPGKSELFLESGQSEVRELKITNRTGKQLIINIGVEDFDGDNIYSTKLLGEDQGKYSLRDYIRFEENKITISHGERIIIPVTIDIPEDCSAGGLYGAVIVSIEGIGDDNGAQINVVSRLASLFFVRVNGSVEENGALKSFETSKKFYQSSPVDFSIVYENKGNVHLSPYATIEIKNILGKKVEEIEISPWFVMPGFTRSRDVTWEKSLAFGRYTAKIELEKGYGTSVDEKEISFWVLPVRVLAIGVSVIIFFSIVIWLFSKKFELKKKI